MEEILNKVSEAWSQANASLFKHVLTYEGKLNAFLDKAGGWIREQEECLWTMMFQITWDIGALLCASLNVLLHLLDTLPSFLANLSYQSQSPIICGFAPKAYAQPWLGLHSLNLPHTPSFDSRRKAEDILKEAIIHSTGSGVATRARTDPSASTSQHPHRSREMPRHSHCAVFPPILHPLYTLLPNADMPSPLLHSTHSLAPLLQARVRHLGADQEGVVRVHRVHRDRVPGLAVAASPRWVPS